MGESEEKQTNCTTFNIFKFLERMNSPSLLFFFFFLVFISKHFSTRLSIWNLYQEWGRGRNDANTLYNSSGQPRVQRGPDGPNVLVVPSSLKSKSLSWETTYYYKNKIPKSLLEFVWNSDPLLESSLRETSENKSLFKYTFPFPFERNHKFVRKT